MAAYPFADPRISGDPRAYCELSTWRARPSRNIDDTVLQVDWRSALSILDDADDLALIRRIAHGLRSFDQALFEAHGLTEGPFAAPNGRSRKSHQAVHRPEPAAGCLRLVAEKLPVVVDRCALMNSYTRLVPHGFDRFDI